MLYSCFDQRRGLYRVFEDGASHPINGDLPVPSLGPNAGRIGVAAVEAARRKPLGAKLVGESWNAKGIVVSCPGSGFGSFEEMKEHWPLALVVAGLAVVGVWWVVRR